MRLTDGDLSALEAAAMVSPTTIPVVAGTGGLRKLRFAPPSWHTGKRGAVRVGLAVFPHAERIYLVTVFPKNEKANLTAAERDGIRDALTFLGQAIRSGAEDIIPRNRKRGGRG